MGGNAEGPLLFISAAEASADLHGASLIRETLRIRPSARFVGVAGPRMVEADCESIFDMTSHAAMLLGALGNTGRAIRMLRACDRHLRKHHFDAVVVIDSPVLHLPLAAKAHALNIPVLYYIAPQMWAWGRYRIHKLRSSTDRVACILPFEEEFFRNEGVDATFVGHPLAQQFAETTIDDDLVREIRARGTPSIAILPGSRKHVVESVLPGQLQVAERIKREIPGASFGVSVANPGVAPIVDRLLSHHSVQVGEHPTHRSELISAADLVLVASGTTTLEIAFHERPMIVMYNASRLFYHMIGRWLISTPFLSLPNILGDREIVPEFMPYYTDIEPIAARAIELLKSPSMQEQMRGDLSKIVEPLRGTNASRRTAEILLAMARSDH